MSLVEEDDGAVLGRNREHLIIWRQHSNGRPTVASLLYARGWHLASGDAFRCKDRVDLRLSQCRPFMRSSHAEKKLQRIREARSNEKKNEKKLEKKIY